MKKILSVALGLILAVMAILGACSLLGKTAGDLLPGGETSATGSDSSGSGGSAGGSSSGDNFFDDNSSSGTDTSDTSTGSDSSDSAELTYADFSLPYRHTTEENEAAQNAIKNNDYSTFFKYRSTSQSYEQWHNTYIKYGGVVVDNANALYCAVYQRGRYSSEYLFTFCTGYSDGTNHTWASWAETSDNEYNFFITDDGNIDFTFEGNEHTSCLMYKDSEGVYNFSVSSDRVSAHTIYYVG